MLKWQTMGMDATLAHLGPRLRAARQAKGLTLEEVAAPADMSVSTLSRLESGKRQATLELLLPLTRILGVRMDDLLAPVSRDPRVKRPAITRDGMRIAPLTQEHAPVQTFRVGYPPRESAPEPRTHAGFEWFFVMSGAIRLLLDGSEHIIDTGEAAEFDTRLPHSLSATMAGPAEVISIFSAAGERIHTHAPGEEGEP